MANIPNAGFEPVRLEQFEGRVNMPDGTHVYIIAPSLAALTATVAALRPTASVRPETPRAQPDAKTEPKENPKGNSQSSGGASSTAGSAEKASTAKQPADANAKPAETPSGDEGELPYEVLQKAVYKLAGIDPAVCKEINASFGVKTMKDLPAGKRREALAAVQAKIDALAVA